MSVKLTKKQAEVYYYIKDYIAEKGYSPSYREISSGVGLSSIASVSEHIDKLIELGALRKLPGRSRSLEALDIERKETTDLFLAKMQQLTNEEQVEILRKAAIILGIDLTEGM